MRLNLRCRYFSKGFSLLEIMVAIAVLLVVALLATPVYRGMSERTRSLHCQQQLRELWGALNQYIGEHNGQFIPIDDKEGRFNGTVPTWGPSWAEYFARFYFNGSKKVLHCPSRPEEWSNAAGYYPDYAYNQRLPQANYFVTLSAVTRPAETVVFADIGRLSGGKRVGGIYSMAAPDHIHYRHTDQTANAVYVDGHVEAKADPGNLSNFDPAHPFNPWVFRDP